MSYIDNLADELFFDLQVELSNDEEGGSFSESVTITATPFRFTGKRCGSSTRSWQSVSVIIRR